MLHVNVIIASNKFAESIKEVPFCNVETEPELHNLTYPMHCESDA